ncbi:MAG: alpha/beta hydrolase fold domain-containing protein [Thermomicrobiales bacterium]
MSLPRPFPSTRSIRIVVLASALVVAHAGASATTESPRPPPQPPTGPGGVAAPFDRVVATRFGEPPTGYWLYEPADADGNVAAGGLEPLPLVIFLHGFTAVDPVSYLIWIEHITRRGAVVLYPDYQTPTPLAVAPEEFLPNVVTAVRHALAQLERGDRAPIDPSKVAVVGHSMGGILAVNLASIAEGAGLPTPKAIMPIEPGGCRECGTGPPGFGAPLADLSRIPASTYAIVVVGEEDNVVGDTGARLIWSGMTAVPFDRRDLIRINSDRYGEPALIADHFMPLTGSVLGTLDALDWYGTWKLFDGLTACAFENIGCDEALGGTSFQRWMGEWSDGTPVTPADVTDDPDAWTGAAT